MKPIHSTHTLQERHPRHPRPHSHHHKLPWRLNSYASTIVNSGNTSNTTTSVPKITAISAVSCAVTATLLSNEWLVATSSISSARLTTFLKVLAVRSSGSQKDPRQDPQQDHSEKVQLSPSYPKISSPCGPSRSAESSICCNCIIIACC